VNLFASFMRTVVPIVAGLVLTLLVHIGVDFGSASVASAVTALLTGLYYTVFRLLESLATKIRSRPLAAVAGILLGWATPPDYPNTTRPALHTAARQSP
jgi:cell division inhibitor SulA